jgi:hypothetical protein
MDIVKGQNYSECQRQIRDKAAREAQILDATERQRSKAVAFCQKQQSKASKKIPYPNKQQARPGENDQGQENGSDRKLSRVCTFKTLAGADLFAVEGLTSTISYFFLSYSDGKKCKQRSLEKLPQ